MGVCGCGSESASGAVRAEESPPPAAATSPEPTAASRRMHDEFFDSQAARRSVIAGDLAAVRPALERLANRQYADELPLDWMPWIEDLQATARKGMEARSLGEAAVAVAALGQSCADCHSATKGGPGEEPASTKYDAAGATGLEERMARHLWSAEELWLGLIGPRHTSWSRGAAALMNITIPKLVTLKGAPATSDQRPTGEGRLADETSPAEPSHAGAVLTPEGANLDPALEELRALGQRADKAAIGLERQQIYAETIERCGTCHAHLGLKIDHTRATY